jgi:hypothetical protein
VPRVDAGAPEVARVNGVPLSARDLVPADDGIPREELEARRAQAIDDELTIQEARRRGLDVDGAIERRLEQERARLEGAKAKWTSVTEAGLGLAARHLAAVALQRQLLEGDGGPVDDAARRRLLERLRSEADIELR